MRDKGNPPTQDDGITELGRRDAGIVAELLQDAAKKDIKIKAIYTSNFYRCKETAKLVNKFIDVPVYEDNRLNEYGSVHKAVKGQKDDNAKETWIECQDRVRAAIKDIVNKYNDHDAVICVTSGVNIASFISLAYGLPSDENAPLIWVPSCSPIIFNIDKNKFEG